MPRSAADRDVRRVLSGSPRVGSIRRCEPRARTTVSIGSVTEDGHIDRGATLPRRPERVPVAGVLRGRDEGELQRRCVNVAGGGGARGVDRGRAVAQGNDRHGPLVHPVGADERGHRRVGVSAVERRGEPRGPGDGEELAEHRSCIPVHVPVSALSVAPAGAPRDPGDDERRRIPARWRSDLHDRVVLRVVPVHARRHSHALRNGDVHLQGETTARGPGGAEQPGRVRSLRRADDPGRQMQQAGELGQIQPRAGDVRGAGEHGDRRCRGGRQVPRKGQSW